MKGQTLILSASRRTDIPNYYSDWFYHRIKEGFLYVRNPINLHQISEIQLFPDVVDCIVFWTKNPEPMMARLEELKQYKYYFQFTLTGYGKEIEHNVPHKKVMIPIFQKLSKQIGSEKVIWRYDPILFTDRYTPEYHLNAFQQIADALKGYTRQCVISFVDLYAKNKKNMDALRIYDMDEAKLLDFAGKLSQIAANNGIETGSCAEKIDLSSRGIRHHSCIDPKLIETILGCKINVHKDKNQRKECGCAESIDIGTYHTCPNGCSYCYANHSIKQVSRNSGKYNPISPLLCGELMEGDKINQRKAKMIKEQIGK